jgi:hypothetical protein
VRRHLLFRYPFVDRIPLDAEIDRDLNCRILTYIIRKPECVSKGSSEFPVAAPDKTVES